MCRLQPSCNLAYLPYNVSIVMQSVAQHFSSRYALSVAISYHVCSTSLKLSGEASMAAETPCSVLYNDIRSFGGLKHLEIARMLINGNSYAGSTCSTNALPTARTSLATSSTASPISVRQVSTMTLPSPHSTLLPPLATSSAEAIAPIRKYPSITAARRPKA